MPETSVVCIAKSEKELKALRNALRKQTYRNFEFVTSNKNGIPQAWNDVFSKARGKIIVVTESDALPMNKDWLMQMVRAVKKGDEKTIIRGIEVSKLPWCFCNIACYSSLLKENRLNESFPVGEDTELFSRLKKMGYKGLEMPIAPVFHKRESKGFKKDIKNYYFYGKLLSKLSLQYGFTGFSENSKDSILKREMTIIFSRIAYMVGMIVGFISFKLKINRMSDDGNDKVR